MQLRHHPRVQQPGDVEIGVGIAAQLDQTTDMMVLQEHADLRLVLVDGGQGLPRRLDEILVVDLHIGLIDDIGVAIEHHDRGKPADAGLEVHEFVELLAVVVEHRFCARELDCDRDGVGTHDPGLLAQIGFRHDQRILDHSFGRFGEQPVEAAVERHAGDDGHQDRRHRGDDRKQRDDAHMEP